jgi:hypothetical protein
LLQCRTLADFRWGGPAQLDHKEVLRGQSRPAGERREQNFRRPGGPRWSRSRARCRAIINDVVPGICYRAVAEVTCLERANCAQLGESRGVQLKLVVEVLEVGNVIWFEDALSDLVKTGTSLPIAKVSDQRIAAPSIIEHVVEAVTGELIGRCIACAAGGGSNERQPCTEPIERVGSATLACRPVNTRT